MSDIKTRKPAKSRTAKLNSKLVENVGMRVEAVIGDARMTLAELSALGAGDVITLDAALNALVELRVNDVVVAHGELVAVDDRFGVRISAVDG